jgi:hypothetical protein
MGLWAAQTAGRITAAAMAVLGAAGAVWCVLYIRKSMTRGWIEYSGNSANTRKQQRYYREETAFGFWAGIFVHGFMALIGAGFAAFSVVLIFA